MQKYCKAFVELVHKKHNSYMYKNVTAICYKKIQLNKNIKNLTEVKL